MMQFSLVVSTNTAGIRCWQRNGFELVGTLPGAFRSRRWLGGDLNSRPWGYESHALTS